MTAPPVTAESGTPSGAGEPLGVGAGGIGFDGNDYRKRVLAPLLAAGVVTLDDPFRLVGVDLGCDDTAFLRARVAEVVGFWQRERNSPRYKGLVGELVKHRAPLEGMLLDPERRALARLRVQGARRAQATARTARIDRLLKAVVNRHGGVPRGRLDLLRRLAEREGLAPDLLAERLAAHPLLEDGTGVEPLPETLRQQVRASLDELAMRGDRARAVSLWSFLGLPGAASSAQVEERHAELVADNLARAHDRDKTVQGELLAHVHALLLEPAPRAAYLAGLVMEVQDRLVDRVLELAVVDGELWPPDVEVLVRETVAGGSGLSAEQARAAVRAAAGSVGVPVTTARAVEPGTCVTCGRSDAADPPVPVSGTAPAADPPLSAGVRAQAQEEWRQAEREVGLRRLVHAAQRLQRLARTTPELPGPSGALPQQRLAELELVLIEARAATERAAGLASPAQQEGALYAVLDAVVDLEEAATALAAVPVAPVDGVTAALDGTTMRLRWSAPPSARAMTYNVVRVTRAADGRRVEHPLGMTTRGEQIDADLPRAGLVWHEVTAVVGARRSAAVATEPQPVVPDVSDLRASQGPDGVTLTWQAAPGSDVVVERRLLDDDEAPLRRSRARGHCFRDADVLPGLRYRYVVRVEAAVGGIVARTPGCMVDVGLPDLAAGPGLSGGAPVQLGLTPHPAGVGVAWSAPADTEVAVVLSPAPLGVPGAEIDLAALPIGARIVGRGLGSGSVFESTPGLAGVFTPVAVAGARALLGEPVRHVGMGPVEALRVEGYGPGARVRFGLPPGCGEALVVWRRDRTPVDAADAEGGEVVTAAALAEGGWTPPEAPDDRYWFLLVLPVAHLAGEPVFGPATPLRLG